MNDIPNAFIYLPIDIRDVSTALDMTGETPWFSNTRCGVVEEVGLWGGNAKQK